MIDFAHACEKAIDFFEKNKGLHGLANATESDEEWFFTAGVDPGKAIGNLVVSVNKASGAVAVVDLLSKVGFDRVRNSVVRSIPDEYRAN